jgi:hypothetical protein
MGDPAMEAPDAHMIVRATQRGAQLEASPRITPAGNDLRTHPGFVRSKVAGLGLPRFELA